MQYGWKDIDFFVNSATGKSADQLCDLGWREISVNGSVSAGQLEAHLKPGETVAGTLWGSVAIRRYVQDHYGVGKTAANDFLRKHVWPISVTVNGVATTQVSSLDALITNQPSRIAKLRSVAGATLPADGKTRGRPPGASG